MSDESKRVEEIVDELFRFRYAFGVIEDDYRQAKIDVAIEAIEEMQNMVEDYKEAGLWPGEEFEDFDEAESLLQLAEEE